MKYIVNTILFLLLPQLTNAISLTDVFHNSSNIFYVNPSVGEIKLRAKNGSITDAFVIVGAKRTKMQKVYEDGNLDYFSVILDQLDTTTTYYFVVKDALDSLIFPAENELKPLVPLFMPPDWAKGKTYYSIFTDGFYNSNKANDPKKTIAWGEKPKKWLSYGGDLKGILQKIAYIDSLDPDIILLQPIFSASSNHKLNPNNYAMIDAALGDTADLKRLINEIHARDKKIVLSVIFTHTGTDFNIFKDIVNTGEKSRYVNWYHIKSIPIKTSPPSYECWRSDFRFPKLNLSNPQVANYLIGYLGYWKRFGFDGFYIGEDTKIDPGFIKKLRTNLKTMYPDILLLSHDIRLLTGNGFDGCINNLYNLLINYFVKNTITTSDFDYQIHRMLFFNPAQTNSINLLNISDYNKRISREADASIIKNIYAFIFTYVGSPVIVYGDEIGLADYAPLNLGSFTWDTKVQHRNLLKDIRRLIKIRKSNPQIADNRFFTLYVNDITKVYAYDRGGLIVVINSSEKQSYVELPTWDGFYLDLISGKKLSAYSQKLRLSIEPKSYRILRREI